WHPLSPSLSSYPNLLTISSNLLTTSIMLPQLDSSKKSKPSTPPTTKRCGIRKRIDDLFSTKKPNPNSEEFNGNEDAEDALPMRVLSPRSSGFDPTTPKRKHHSVSFRKRRSKTLSPSSRHDTI